MISVEDIQSLVEAALPGSTVQVRDFTGGGDHFEAVVVSAEFAGKGLVERHRMVYTPLGKAMRVEDIHALALKTYTPEEFDKQKGGS
jgi:acid stress-induced BolA-like protein IbaG/YrbA